MEPPESAPVLVRRDGAVTTLTLNRPARLNAVSLPLYDSLTESLRTISSDSSTRALVITGAGRAFSVGADLKAHGETEPTPDERRYYIAAAQQANRQLQALPKPVVAAVNGHAIGAGLELALSCDLIIVAEEAKLRLPELALGTFVGGGVTYTLAERVGLAKAKELVFLADFIEGKEAVRLGLANQCVPSAQVRETAASLAVRLAAMAPLSLALAKRLFDRAGAIDRDAALAEEGEALLECMQTRDWREGINAFHERREPRFTGS
ncbi:MAG TPA: enoyl-CoA hydratase-related protein [Gemmatimonadales bacterium]|nr:enoyl-CoA hydratase-related protein [Gemmatimonadales bacterium]